MPRIIEYEHVLARMAALNMPCNYYNSGSFGFAPGVETIFLGWIGLDDSTIRPEILQKTRKIREPFQASMIDATIRVWQDILRGLAWIMPASHWAFELDFGSRAWLPGVLKSIGISAAELNCRTNASAIEFDFDEILPYRILLDALLNNLVSSDFSLVFPDQRLICTIHHHKQLWWQTPDARLMSYIDAATPLANSPSTE